MNKFFISTKNLILSKQRTLLSSALIVALMIVLSSLFGFLRYRTLANYFIKSDLDVFFASFRIPDIIFEILITGALTSSFIPIFIKYKDDQKKLNESISSIINIISLCLVGFILIVVVFADQIFPFITPGFSPSQLTRVILFSRILLLGQLPFLVLGNFLTGIGQANKIFMASAIAPVLYNLVIILATVMFAPSFHLLAPIIGVVFGAVILFLVQLPLYFSSGFVYRPIIRFTKALREFFRLVVPRIITVIAAQIDATVDLTITTLLQSGSYTTFYLAQRLQLLPVSVIGIAFGQASLPYLTEVYQKKDMEEFKRIVTESLLSTFFLTFPIMAFFIFARTPLVRLFFGGDKFDWSATNLTALTLSYFALSIPVHSIYYFLTRCFYAFLDSKTPFLVSVFSILLNVGLSVYFVFGLHLPVWALGASFSISIFCSVVLLLTVLAKKIHGLGYKLVFLETIKIFIATFISSFFSYYLMKVLDGLILDTSRTLNIFFLLLVGGVCYIALYLFLAWMLGVREFSLLMKFSRKARAYRQKFVEIYTDIE